MGDLALQVSVEKDTLGRFLSFAQVIAQARIVEELQVQREQIQYQIAVLQQSNVVAEQMLAIQQKRLELEEKERAERAAQQERLRHLRNILAETTLEFEDLHAELDGRSAP